MALNRINDLQGRKSVWESASEIFDLESPTVVMGISALKPVSRIGASEIP